MSEAGTFLGWTVTANISDFLRGGVDPEKFYQGTRMFSPGTRVYIGETYWGIAGEAVHVVGLHRTSRHWVNCIISTHVLENIRAASVYSPALWARLEKLEASRYPTREEAEENVMLFERVRRDSAPSKIATELRTGPWGEAEHQPYRDGDE